MSGLYGVRHSSGGTDAGGLEDAWKPSRSAYTFEPSGTIIMYCQRLFLLFTGKQHCLPNIFSGDLPAMNICLHAKFQVQWCYGFGSTALQQE